jgi:hypothetical protein
MGRSKALKKARCLTGCGRSGVKRGLCLSCYQIAQRRIQNEEATEKELTDLGLLLPSRQGMRDTAFQQALDKQRKLAEAAGK